MKNLKVKVNNEAESKEAQELFFELGFTWAGNSKSILKFDTPEYIVNWSNNHITIGDHLDENRKEITLPELRSMVFVDEPFFTPECTLNDQYAEIEQARQHRHYFKDVSNIDEIDVYMVLKLFNVTDPCLQHIAKKALCAGRRGHKDFKKDLQDILDTAVRAVDINK